MACVSSETRQVRSAVTFRPATKTYELVFAEARPAPAAVVDAIASLPPVVNVDLYRYQREGIVAVSVSYEAEETMLSQQLTNALEMISGPQGLPEHLLAPV